MSFLSPEFALFLALGCALFHGLPASARAPLLLVLSYAFYASWVPAHALLLFGLTLATQGAARAIDVAAAERHKFRLTVLAVTALLTLLALFKWHPVLIAESSGGATAWIVPLGLSYFLFKMLGYVLDVYWGKVERRRDFVSVALYFSFFPQIVSGPIQRADDFFGQLPNLARSEPSEITAGLRRILLGLVKKVVIADRLGLLVAAVHGDIPGASAAELLLAAYCFTLQLYMDFSGITDLAVGVGQLFGVKGPENFSLPFLAPNIQEFWRRWHISLTSWLSDYLFLPLRMALRRLGTAGLAAAIFLTMLAVGVWHGSSATFAVFGAVNGLFMVVSVLTFKRRQAFLQAHPRWESAHRITGPVITFHLIAFALIFFRAPTLDDAAAYLRGLFPIHHPHQSELFRLDFTRLDLTAGALLATLAGVVALDGFEWVRRRPGSRAWLVALPRPLRWTAYYAAILAVMLSASLAEQFIYARF